MEKLTVERLGGLAGFGLPGAHLKSRGELELAALSPADQATINTLFASSAVPEAPHPDGFRYRLTRHTPTGTNTIEVAEQRMPLAVKNCVKDELE